MRTGFLARGWVSGVEDGDKRGGWRRDEAGNPRSSGWRGGIWKSRMRGIWLNFRGMDGESTFPAGTTTATGIWFLFVGGCRGSRGGRGGGGPGYAVVAERGKRLRGCGGCRGPSTPSVARCATDFAQDDGLVVVRTGLRLVRTDEAGICTKKGVARGEGCALESRYRAWGGAAAGWATRNVPFGVEFWRAPAGLNELEWGEMP